MKGLGFRKGGELGDGFKLAEELADHFTGIVAATQGLHLLEDPAERGFGLRDRHLGVILAVLFQALMMFLELFAEELGEALTRGAVRAAGAARQRTTVVKRLFEAILAGRKFSVGRYQVYCQTRPIQPPLIARRSSSVTAFGLALPRRLHDLPHQKAQHVVAPVADLRRPSPDARR